MAVRTGLAMMASGFDMWWSSGGLFGKGHVLPRREAAMDGSFKRARRRNGVEDGPELPEVVVQQVQASVGLVGVDPQLVLDADHLGRAVLALADEPHGGAAQ